MADMAVSLATRFGESHQRLLLRHALGSPPLARLLLPRLASAAPGLLRPPRRAAEEISHVLVESADSEGALEAATLLMRVTEPPPDTNSDGSSGDGGSGGGAARATGVAAAAGAAGYTQAERGELLRLLAARRPASLLEWHWLQQALAAERGEDGAPLAARPLPIVAGYWGVLQVGAVEGLAGFWLAGRGRRRAAACF